MIDRLTEEFHDYWDAKPGKEARKIDWDKTWHNRVRNLPSHHWAWGKQKREPEYGVIGVGSSW